MKHLCWIAVLLLSVCVPAASIAQSYPSKPVRLVVSFPPGSTPDTVARVLAPRLQASYGQVFIVENRAGAGGNLAADLVAKAEADGYTLLVSTNAAVATNKVLYSNLPYDPERDLATISLLAYAPQILAVNSNVPVSDFKGFLAYMKGNPGRLSYGSAGSGSASHLTMELLKADAGVFAVHIPYRGFPQAVSDMLGGNVQAMFAIAPILLPHIKAGKLRGLAVTALRRSDQAPELPSVAELGYPQLESLSWIGLLAPGRTPVDITDRLAAETQRALRQLDARKVLESQGFEVVGSGPLEFRRFQQAEIVKWGRVIRATGAQPD
jgi:tripartite-type tricarboxylate transporter receptor subunit TctC